MKKWSSLLLIFLVAISGNFFTQTTSAVEYQTHTDFIANADRAKWESSYGDQPFPGKQGSRNGAAYWLKNVTMENGIICPLILQTTPDLKSSGYIMGTYPEITIPEKARLNVEFGFPKNADKTKGVTFHVSFHTSAVKPSILEIVSKFKIYTKDTEKVIVDLADFAGRKGNFVVKVIGGKTPTMSDVASWNKIILEKEKLVEKPDLIITNILVSDYKVSYMLKNIGKGPVAGLRKGQNYETKLTVNGQEVATDRVTLLLEPQEEVKRTFSDYTLPKYTVEQTLTTCADVNNLVAESNERNNCYQKKFTPEPIQEPPDLIIKSILVTDGVVSYTIKNIGKGATVTIRKGKVFLVSMKLDGQVVAEDAIAKVLIPQEEMTKTFQNFILPTSDKEQGLEICADSEDAYAELNEQNNCLTKRIPPDQVTEKPDLIVSNIIVENGNVSYTLKNTGKGYATNIASGKKFQTKLLLDGREAALDTLSRGLIPGGEVTRTFERYHLPGSKLEQVVKICADSDNAFLETNEENNCLEKRIPPEPEEELRLTKFPEVSDITQTSVKITWETNIDSTSEVYYDNRYSLFALSKTEYKHTKIHELTVKNLKPDTLYHFYVRSLDAKQHQVTSKPDFFKTRSESIAQTPTLHFALPEKLTGKIKIRPLLSDEKHFRKLRLFLDGKLVFINYTKPFEMELDTVKFPNGRHQLKVEGYDINGRNIAEVHEGIFFNPELVVNLGPVVDITAPNNSYEFPNTTTEIPIKATINHLSGLDIKTVSVYVDGHLVYSSAFSKRKRNKIWASAENLPKGFDHTISIDKFGEGGTHQIEVKALDSAGKIISAFISVVTHTPYWKRPALTCYYGASIKAWTGNHYMIDFYIANNGTATAKDIDIHVYQDFLPGFIITNVNPPRMASFDWDTHQQVLRIYLSELGYKPDNKVYHFTFDLAPVLTPYCDWDDFVMINEVKMCYDWEENTEAPEIYTLDISQDAGIDTEWMAGNCDYLIASNYASLFDTTTSTTRNPMQTLLKNMSELAIKRQGVVGLITSSTAGPFTAKARLHNMGNKLKSNWEDDGYLLLVGETEVIPSFSISLDVGDEILTFESDSIFANTAGSYNSPELTVGRIIGDTINSLNKPIKASLDVIQGTAYFRRNEDPSSVAYCLSGTGDGESSFWNNTDEVHEILEDEMHSVYARRSKDIINGGHNVHQDIRDHCNGLSVLFWRDHGGTHCWCDGVKVADSHSTDTAYAGHFDFGWYRPFIFACCCDSGTYSGIYGIANSLMEKASTYIGSTEVSGRGSNNTYAKYFFNSWVDHPGKSLATAFKETRIESRNDTLWNLEYQFYGDVKFGIVP